MAMPHAGELQSAIRRRRTEALRIRFHPLVRALNMHPYRVGHASSAAMVSLADRMLARRRVSGCMVHVFLARIVYRMLREPWLQRLWLGFSMLMISGVIAGGLGSGIIYAHVEQQPLFGLIGQLEVINLDLDFHLIWAIASSLFDLTLSAILVTKLLTSVNDFSFPSTNSKLVSLAISVLETLALPTMASMTCCGLAISGSSSSARSGIWVNEHSFQAYDGCRHSSWCRSLHLST